MVILKLNNIFKIAGSLLDFKQLQKRLSTVNCETVFSCPYAIKCPQQVTKVVYLFILKALGVWRGRKSFRLRVLKNVFKKIVNLILKNDYFCCYYLFNCSEMYCMLWFLLDLYQSRCCYKLGVLIALAIYTLNNTLVSHSICI